MSYDKNLTVRVNDPWLHTFGEILNVVAKGKTRDRSRLIRQLVTKEASLWLDCPYVATSSKHFVFISGNGDGYYQAVQTLELKARRAKLPASVGMKPEKQSYYLNLFKGQADEADRIRKHWLINHFSAWLGTDLEGPPISSHVDRIGIASKKADLPINQPKNTIITREKIVANHDFVQRRPSAENTVEGDYIASSAEDRASISVDIPTLNLDIQLLVDLSLYGKDTMTREAAAAGYELRNHEGARLERRRIGSEDNLIDWVEDRWPDVNNLGPGTEATLEQVRSSFEVMSKRLTYLADEKTLAADGLPVADDDARETLLSLEIPPSFLFGRLLWPLPYQGLEIGITWHKPE